MVVDPEYQFRAVVADDLPLLYQGLQQDDVRRWWGEPEHELELIRNDLNSPLIVLNLVLWQGRPVAFIQDYRIHDWPQEHLIHLPEAARAIDTFVIDAKDRGRGHCARYLRQRARQLLQQSTPSCPLVIIDPEPDNRRAIRAYTKAGFSSAHPSARQTADALVMIFVDSSSLSEFEEST